MNRQRRKELARAMELIGEARSIIENCCEEEQDAFDNMPEGIQASERGEQMEEYISTMEDVISNIEDAESGLEEIA